MTFAEGLATAARSRPLRRRQKCESNRARAANLAGVTVSTSQEMHPKYQNFQKLRSACGWRTNKRPNVSASPMAIRVFVQDFVHIARAELAPRVKIDAGVVEDPGASMGGLGHPSSLFNRQRRSKLD